MLRERFVLEKSPKIREIETLSGILFRNGIYLLCCRDLVIEQVFTQTGMVVMNLKRFVDIAFVCMTFVFAAIAAEAPPREVGPKKSHRLGMQSCIVYKYERISSDETPRYEPLSEEDLAKLESCALERDREFQEKSYWRTGLDFTIVPYKFFVHQDKLSPETKALSELAVSIDSAYNYLNYDRSCTDRGNGGAGLAYISSRMLTTALCGGAFVHEMMHTYGMHHTASQTSISGIKTVHKVLLGWLPQDEDSLGFCYKWINESGRYRVYSDQSLTPVPGGHRAAVVLKKKNEFMHRQPAYVLSLEKLRFGLTVDTISGLAMPYINHGHGRVDMDPNEDKCQRLAVGRDFTDAENGITIKNLETFEGVDGMPEYIEFDVILDGETGVAPLVVNDHKRQYRQTTPSLLIGNASGRTSLSGERAGRVYTVLGRGVRTTLKPGENALPDGVFIHSR